jgi:hypothetical protein
MLTKIFVHIMPINIKKLTAKKKILKNVSMYIKKVAEKNPGRFWRP